MKLPNILVASTPAEMLFNLIASICEIFKDQNGEAYAVIYNGNKYQVQYLTQAENSKLFLRECYFKKYQKLLKSQDLTNVYETLCAFAKNCTEEIPVYIRIGGTKDTFYYDLCSPSGELVQITEKGVAIVPKTSVNNMFFYQDDYMQEQVKLSVSAGYKLLDFIREVFNVSQGQELLLAVYICICFIYNISHPIVVVEGEKGAGKTTFMRRLLGIVNPTRKDVIALPRNGDDLVTILSHNIYSAFDNCGKLTDDVMETLCRAATGSTIIKRKLYTDNSEIPINIWRMVAINGINLEISKDDFLDRCIMVRLNRIDSSARLSDLELREKFKKMLPYILGDIFDILSKAMAIYTKNRPVDAQRMVDFSKYGYAVAEAINQGYGDIFLQQYDENVELAVQTVVDENPLLTCVVSMMEQEDEWTGKSADLLSKLRGYAQQIYGKCLPNVLIAANANVLSKKLMAYSHELSTMGISVERGRKSNRYIILRKIISKSTDAAGDNDNKKEKSE